MLSAAIKLWKNFAKSVGADGEKIENVKLDWFTKDMIDNFFSQARKSYAEGLASLYTYERQIPEIAETKINGLKNLFFIPPPLLLDNTEQEAACFKSKVQPR